jgi:hypothetical protein
MEGFRVIGLPISVKAPSLVRNVEKLLMNRQSPVERTTPKNIFDQIPREMPRTSQSSAPSYILSLVSILKARNIRLLLILVIPNIKYRAASF